MSALIQRISRMSLSSRIVVVMLALLLAVQLASFWAVRVALERQIRSEINSDLIVAERVWGRLLEQNAERLREASVVLAADYGFRAAVTTDDKDTIESALENNGERIGAAITALLDPDLNLVSYSQRDMSDAALTGKLHDIGIALASTRDAGRIDLINGNLYQFVMVQVRAPRLVGWVLMGFPIGQPLLDSLQRLSGVHAVLLAGDSKNTTLMQSTMDVSLAPVIHAA